MQANAALCDDCFRLWESYERDPRGQGGGETSQPLFRPNLYLNTRHTNHHTARLVVINMASQLAFQSSYEVVDLLV